MIDSIRIVADKYDERETARIGKYSRPVEVREDVMTVDTGKIIVKLELDEGMAEGIREIVREELRNHRYVVDMGGVLPEQIGPTA